MRFYSHRAIPAFLLACLLAAVSFMTLPGAQRPWKNKPIAQWTQDDLQALLTSSPWTKKINLWQLSGRSLAVFSDGSTAIYREKPSGPTIHYTVEPVRIEPERLLAVYAVRWSSASIVTQTMERLREITPVLAQMQAPPPELSPNHYVLTVRVVQPPTETFADKASRAIVRDMNDRPLKNAPAGASDIFAGLEEEQLRAAAELRTNQKLRLHPDRVVRHGIGAGEGISFLFPRRRDGQPILLPDTKWAEFRFKDKLGNQLKARFKLKEMQADRQPDY